MGCATSTPPVSETVVEVVSNVSAADKSLPVEDFHDRYILGEKLGRGVFGQVRIAKLATKETNAFVNDKAVKILELREPEDAAVKGKSKATRALTESRLWLLATAAKHAQIVHLDEVFTDSQFCYFVMEKCHCEMFEYMESQTVLNERSVGDILAQMLQGIAHVHSVGVVHRDIKASNFLIGGENGCTVKLCDFGLSVALPNIGCVRGISGTVPYMSPEMLRGDYYDSRTDIWSLGVLAYTLLFGMFPYTPEVKSSKAMKQAILNGKTPTFIPTTPFMGQRRSKAAITFTRSLLDRGPQARISADEALKLPYMMPNADAQEFLSDELHSLRPMLYSAKKEGAFEQRSVSDEEIDIDGLLDTMQKAKQREGLPDLRRCPIKTSALSSSDGESTVTGDSMKTACSHDDSNSFSRTSSAAI